MFYCLSESSFKWHIENNHQDQIITFEKLYQQQITSAQLYTWSAPIDVAERYQYFLENIEMFNGTSMANEVFYNCTGPRFGPFCQYSFDDYEPLHSSLNEIFNDSYLQRTKSTTYTCYTHLVCNFGFKSLCLDWSEICDGKIDCIDDGRDEENCWQLEMSECGKDEYRCMNGQCIPYNFFFDDLNMPDCLDGSDERDKEEVELGICYAGLPTFACEEITCQMIDRPARLTFQSSCVNKHLTVIQKALFSQKPDFINMTCWSTLLCWLHAVDSSSPICSPCYNSNICTKIIRESCPDLILIPNGPVLFGNIYFAYTNNEAIFHFNEIAMPQYICYKSPMCEELFDKTTYVSFNNLTCYHPHEYLLPRVISGSDWITNILDWIFTYFWACKTSVFPYASPTNKSSLYQCLNSSKLISKSRLNNGIKDCLYEDDEHYMSINGSCDIDRFVNCESTGLCLASRHIKDGTCHCLSLDDNICDDEDVEIANSRKHISFQVLCDGFAELKPINIDGKNQTDETNCEEYPCNHTYTRCDGIWNCLNGADEANCDPSPIIECPQHHHICVSPEEDRFACLPIEKAGDGHADCLGATDELTMCENMLVGRQNYAFYCADEFNTFCISNSLLCDRRVDCPNEDDERFCQYKVDMLYDCNSRANKNKTSCNDIEIYFHERESQSNELKRLVVYFSLDFEQKAPGHTLQGEIGKKITQSTIHTSIIQQEQRCHRGVPVTVWLDVDNSLTTDTCLCPPSLYGDQCQYQNQRISLTVTFETFSDSRRTPFLLLILLIDNGTQRIVHSYEQLTYLPIQDCKIKFNLYLLYAIRPKIADPMFYSIHIDIYEKSSLEYRGSFLLSLPFSFLPVHRIATRLLIPRSVQDSEKCFDKNCINGECQKYTNSPNGTTFCRCHQGWSGRHCTERHNCSCSSDSLCIGKAADNRPICVCPIGKFGQRCLLTNSICGKSRNETCHNDGQCIPTDEHSPSNKKFVCLCQKGFTGDQCEVRDAEIILTIDKNVYLPESMLVHFVEVRLDGPPIISTTLKRIPIQHRKVNVRWSHPFHLLFIEFTKNNYYLSFVQKKYNRSITYIKTIKPSDHCPHISELFDQTFLQRHILQRMKRYHIPCQNRSTRLSCFYDERHMCICDDFGEQRLVNCFEFDHQMKRDCFGNSECQNGASCFQDSQVCPQTSICLCPECFYGTRCQFSTHGFGLSLDAILGYHIRPHINTQNQFPAVRISIAVSTIMIFLGLMNGILSFITFRSKAILEYGCGYYLLGSSITTLLTFTLWTFKFWILMLSQMAYISNESFLYAQCILFEFLLRICLTMDQWLNGCVAVDRAMVVVKGINFNPKRSKKIAKSVIIGLITVTIGTTIHDPLHRRLIDDENEDERRLWCTISYSSHLKNYDSTIQIIHFIIPFVMNLIAATGIIIVTAKQRGAVHRDLTYRQNLYQQFREHYNLLCAPCILIIIGIPRLILSFASGCMNSARESWLFLVGYFISFIPPMLTFILFVVPSTVYMKEFRKSITISARSVP